MKSQMLEGTLPELKDGLYIGDEISKDHPYFVNKKLNSGPNMWPPEDVVFNVADFKATALDYYSQVVSLAKDILKVLALTLDLEESWFDEYAHDAVATMRLLHYPSQPPDSPVKLTRGIGAHTDFGCVTILLQDKVADLRLRHERMARRCTHTRCVRRQPWQSDDAIVQRQIHLQPPPGHQCLWRVTILNSRLLQR